MVEELKQYEIIDLDDSLSTRVAVCLACGAYSLTGEPWDVKHYAGCGGIKEIQKWNEYYEDWDKKSS